MRVFRLEAVHFRKRTSAAESWIRLTHGVHTLRG
jgi:hypothetical protein